MNPSAHFYYVWNVHQIKNVLQFVSNPWLVHVLSCNFKSPSLISLFYFIKSFLFLDALKIDLSGNFWTPFYVFSSKQNIVFQHHPWWNISNKKIRSFFCWINFKISVFFKPRIIVLGKWIYYNINLSCNYSEKEKALFSWITHPFLVKIDLKRSIDINTSYFWFFGKQNLFYKWNNEYKRATNILKRYSVNILDFTSWDLKLNEYYDKFSETGYVVILYLQNYLFSCSGVFIDAIVNLKPIICIESWMAQYFFDKYGDIWFMCKNSDDLINRVLSIQKLSYEERNKIYLKHLKNLSLAKKDIVSLKKNSVEYIKNLSTYEY